MLNFNNGQPARGFCVWLTGLPCSGKTTIATALAASIERRGRAVTVLDGDVVRRVLAPDLGFSREHRLANASRIAWVAREIVRHGGAVVCAVITPYAADRAKVRAQFADEVFVEAYLSTPLEICEQRDVKGLYRRARIGEIRDFTGVDAPYEVPATPEVVCDTSMVSVDESVARIESAVTAIGISLQERLFVPI